MITAVNGQRYAFCDDVCKRAFINYGMSRLGPHVQDGKEISMSEWSLNNKACACCAHKVKP